jgi:hypothetical protein
MMYRNASIAVHCHDLVIVSQGLLVFNHRGAEGKKNEESLAGTMKG